MSFEHPYRDVAFPIAKHRPRRWRMWRRTKWIWFKLTVEPCRFCIFCQGSHGPSYVCRRMRQKNNFKKFGHHWAMAINVLARVLSGGRHRRPLSLMFLDQSMREALKEIGPSIQAVHETLAS